MSWIDDTLRDFGRQMGIEALSFGAHGATQLVFQDGAVLALEPVDRKGTEEVLIYLSRPMGFDAPKLRQLALTQAHFKNASPAFSVQAVSHGQGPDGHLVALIRLPARGFTLQTLDRAYEHLSRWHNGVVNA